MGGGVLFGPWIGVLTVLSGEALGLTLNWRLCRGVLRPRVQRWLARQRRGRRLRQLLERPASLKLLLLLRLAAIPMNLVNAACALGPTPLRSYGLASLILVPRFTLMVLAGALGASASQGRCGSGRRGESVRARTPHHTRKATPLYHAGHHAGSRNCAADQAVSRGSRCR